MAFLALLSDLENYVSPTIAADFGGLITTTTTHQTDFPAINVQSNPVSKRAKSALGTLSDDFLIDLGVARKIDFGAVLNHNLTSAATISLKAGTGTSVIDFDATIPWRQNDAFFYVPAEQEYRYWKITYSDPGNPDNYVAAGRLVLGDMHRLVGFNFSFGWDREKRSVNTVQRTPLGVPHVAKRYKHVALRFDFQSLTLDQSDELETLLDALDGEANPVFVIPDLDLDDGYWMRMVSTIKRTVRSYRNYELMSVTFEEEPRGIVLT